MSDFERELVYLINKHSVENLSDTADWILARYLMECLAAFSNATGARNKEVTELIELEERKQSDLEELRQMATTDPQREEKE